MRQLEERNISRNLVKKVMRSPGQIISSYGNREIAQKVVECGGEKFLIRIAYEKKKAELEIITVYLTKKIRKYWR